MCKRLIILISMVAVLNIASSAPAELILHWTFDDGSGDIASDSSGNGRDGTLQDNPTWVAGKIGGALEFSGDGDHVVDETAGDYINGLDAMTVCVWVKSDQVGTDKGFVIFEDPTGGDNRNIRYDASSWAWEGGTNLIKTAVDSTGGHQAYEGSDNKQTTEWQHVAMIWSSGNELLLYIDGELDTPRGTDAGTTGTVTGVTKLIVGKGCKDADGSWDGLIDDVRIYNEALTAETIQEIMVGEGYPYAIGPDPTDGSLYEDTWATLSWSAGDFAVSHDVYIGVDFDDVNNGTGDTYQTNTTDAFIVVGFPGFPLSEGLIPGTTYYWRVDEINPDDPNSPWTGKVWNFTVPPKTAYFPDPAEDAESVRLDVVLSWTAGFGAKFHTVYFGDNFDEVNNAAGGVPVGTTTYAPGQLKLAKTYYWRVDEFDGAETSKGQIWSFTTEGAAGGPNPADGAEGVNPSVILSWEAGAVAASHDVYFGTDADAVANATTASPQYKGPKALAEESYDPGILSLNTAYFWRIDEVNGVDPDSPWAGKVWSFTTGNYFVIDDFEGYNADDNQIWFSWHDGLGAGAPGTPEYLPGNGTGSAVGDETTASYTEETIFHSGSQSMPIVYDNNKQGNAYYSQVEYTLTDQRDFTAEGIVELSIWFRGNAASVGSFTEGPAGTYSVTASGADIWNDADEFHYAYKMLTGPGTIIARVESVQQTDNWAKAGLMIRETLDAGSKFAAVYITPTNATGAATNGCRFQARTNTDSDATSDSSVATTEQQEIIAPYWIKLERDVAGNFRGSYSDDGTTWRQMAWNPQNISMSANVYVGLALTSHNNNTTCEAVFSNVTMTGNVSGQWTSQDIGIESNDPEPLYVALANKTGAPAVVVNNDPAAANIETWTEWIIPLSTFADQGIVLTDVDSIAIGLGTQGNTTIPGGKGKVYIDDIRLKQPTEAAE